MRLSVELAAHTELAINLSRIWEHLQNPDESFLCVTAYNANPNNENMSTLSDAAEIKMFNSRKNRTNSQQQGTLYGILKTLHIPYAKLEGHYTENYKDPNGDVINIPVTEASVMLMGSGKDGYVKIVKAGLLLMKKFRQQSILVKPFGGDTVYLWYSADPSIAEDAGVRPKAIKRLGKFSTNIVGTWLRRNSKIFFKGDASEFYSKGRGSAYFKFTDAVGFDADGKDSVWSED